MRDTATVRRESVKKEKGIGKKELSLALELRGKEIIDTESQHTERLDSESIPAYMSAIADLDGLSENQQRFLSEYVKDGLTGFAAQRAGIRIGSVYTWKHNPIFLAAFNEATKICNEGIEKLALDMASGIYSEPLVSGGHYVCEKPIRDTKMLAMVLRGRMPERYGQKTDTGTGSPSLVKLVDRDSWDAL